MTSFPAKENLWRAPRAINRAQLPSLAGSNRSGSVSISRTASRFVTAPRQETKSRDVTVMRSFMSRRCGKDAPAWTQVYGKMTAGQAEALQKFTILDLTTD